jgi:hypothetical protein
MEAGNDDLHGMLLRICKVRENWFKQDTQCAYKVKLRRVRE